MEREKGREGLGMMSEVKGSCERLRMMLWIWDLELRRVVRSMHVVSSNIFRLCTIDVWKLVRS